jgi:uncharacterized membrane protein YhhN
VCLLSAFTADSPFAPHPTPFLAFGAAGAALLFVLWPGIGRSTRIPVVIYVVMLLAMAAQASSRALQLRSTTSLAAGAGAALFAVSDSLLAIDRFRSPLRGGRALVRLTYFTAQWLIAMSTVSV